MDKLVRLMASPAWRRQPKRVMHACHSLARAWQSHNCFHKYKSIRARPWIHRRPCVISVVLYISDGGENINRVQTTQLFSSGISLFSFCGTGGWLREMQKLINRNTPLCMRLISEWKLIDEFIKVYKFMNEIKLINARNKMNKRWETFMEINKGLVHDALN